MAQEYTITKISEDEPREWKGEFGTVYYIKVKLEGHNKPVTIGKKSPDALKVGDKVFGDIKPTEYPEDGFKSVNPVGDNSKLENKLDAIAGDVKLLLSFVRQLQKDEPIQELDNVVEDIGDEPMNLDDIPF